MAGEPVGGAPRHRRRPAFTTLRRPTRHESYVPAVIRGGPPTHAVPCDTAVAALRLAERIQATS